MESNYIQVKWSELPPEIQARKEVSWGEVPSNLDVSSVPSGVTIKALTGDAAKQAWAEFRENAKKIAERVGPLTEEEISQIANDRS